jgi:hypothetical protein
MTTESAARIGVSLRRHLLVGILVPVVLFVLVDTISLYQQALAAVNVAYDRTLLASATLVEIDVRRVEDLRRGRPHSHFEAFRHREEVSRNGEGAGVEVDRLVLGRTGREDRELDVGAAGLAATDGAAVIDADLRAKRFGRTRQHVGNERGSMRADATFVLLAGDLERLAIIILTDAGLA